MWSVVICSYNPDLEIFERCLQKIEILRSKTPFESEVVIVDNNSDPALRNFRFVQEFVAAGRERKLVVEPRIGLTSARLAGYRAASGDFLVYIDDDNLPESDFLIAARRTLEENPFVGTCGPGIIRVEFAPGTPQWLNHYAAVFQEKKRPSAQFSGDLGWPDFFPPGSGLVVRRRIMEEYARLITSGELSTTDRLGNNLSSGGDAQIVWTGIKLGYSAGTTPDLKLVHLVAKRKASLLYVYRLVFGVMASGQTALAECFPEQRRRFAFQLPTSAQLYRDVLREVLRHVVRLRLRSGPVTVLSHLGELYGKYIAAGQHPPWILRLAAKGIGYA